MHPSGAYLAHVALPTLQWSTGYNCIHIKSTMVARQQPSHMTVYYSLCVFMCVYVYVYLMINSQTEIFLRSSCSSLTVQCVCITGRCTILL